MKFSKWKDRPGRVRIMASDGTGYHEDARRYFYKKYYPNENIDGFRILQLDMNPYNMRKTNLIKITPQVMNCLLNNKLLSKNASLNLTAIRTIELELLCKKQNDI